MNVYESLNIGCILRALDAQPQKPGNERFGREIALHYRGEGFTIESFANSYSNYRNNTRNLPEKWRNVNFAQAFAQAVKKMGYFCESDRSSMKSLLAMIQLNVQYDDTLDGVEKLKLIKQCCEVDHITTYRKKAGETYETRYVDTFYDTFRRMVTIAVVHNGGNNQPSPADSHNCDTGYVGYKKQKDEERRQRGRPIVPQNQIAPLDQRENMEKRITKTNAFPWPQNCVDKEKLVEDAAEGLAAYPAKFGATGEFTEALPCLSAERVGYFELIDGMAADGCGLGMDSFVFKTLKPEVYVELPKHIPEERKLATYDKFEADSVISGYSPESYLKAGIAEISGLSSKETPYFFTITPLLYVDHFVIRDYFKENEEAIQTDVRDKLRGRGQDIISGTYWAMGGCGIWVLSKDNCLILSLRRRVVELPGTLGYSAAGSCEYTNRLNDAENFAQLEANAFSTAAQEIKEELNLFVYPHELRLITFGVELKRYLMQFSFLWKAETKTAEQIIDEARKADSLHEQLTFAVPFDKETITGIVREYDMEPGAAFSLMKLVENIEAIRN